MKTLMAGLRFVLALAGPLSQGAATAAEGVFRFEFVGLPEWVMPGTPVQVRIRALDASGQLPSDGAFSLGLSARRDPGVSVVISELSADGETVEMTNPGDVSVDVSGWELEAIPSGLRQDQVVRVRIPGPAVVPPGGVFLWRGGVEGPGLFPEVSTGSRLGELGTGLAGLNLREPSGRVVDTLLVSLDLAAARESAWTGGEAIRPTGPGLSLQRWGRANHHGRGDWRSDRETLGAVNPGLTLPWAGPWKEMEVSPRRVNLVRGEWVGEVLIPVAAHRTWLVVQDGTGHLSVSTAIRALPQPPLVLEVEDTIRQASEAKSGTVGQGHVVAPAAASIPRVVRLSVSYPGEFAVPAQVTLPAGATSVAFAITNRDDLVADGRAVVRLTAELEGHQTAVARLVNDDNEHGVLSLQLPSRVLEGSGLRTALGRVVLPSAALHDVEVLLHADGLISAASEVVIPAGQVSMEFPAVAGDDPYVNRPGQTATVRASMPGWATAVGVVEVTDNDAFAFDIEVPSEWREGETVVGRLRLRHPLDGEGEFVLEQAGDALVVPARIPVRADATEIEFRASVRDNTEADPEYRSQSLCYRFEGLETRCVSVTPLDDEVRVEELRVSAASAVFAGRPFRLEARLVGPQGRIERTNALGEARMVRASAVGGLGLSPDPSTVAFEQGVAVASLVAAEPRLGGVIEVSAAGTTGRTAPVDILDGHRVAGPFADLLPIPGTDRVLLLGGGVTAGAFLLEMEAGSGTTNRILMLPRPATVMALDPSGTEVWLGSTSNTVQRVDLTGWRVVSELNLGPVGEPRRARALARVAEESSTDRLLVLVETLGSGTPSGEVRLVAYQSGNPLPRTVSFPSAAMFTLFAGRHAEEWLVSTPESLALVKVGPGGPEVESVRTLTLLAGRASGAVRMGNVVYGESGAEILMEPFEVRVPNVANVLSTLAEGGRARSYLEASGQMRVVDTSTGELRSSHGVPPARNGLLPRRFVAWGRAGFAALTSDRMECLVWRSPYVATGTADVGLTVTAPTSVTLDSTPSGIRPVTLTWRWMVTNAGPDRAEGVMLDLPLLGSQWVGRMEPGELREFRETRVGTQFGWVTGEGRVSSGTRDLVRDNQRVVARTLVREPALGDARHVAVAPGELAASADGARLWVVRDSDHDGEEPGLLEMDPLTGLGVRTLPTDTPPRRLRVDPSGGWVGAVLGSDTVVEWELGAGGREVRWTFPGELVRDGVWVPRQPGVRIVATDRRTVVWENGRARAQAAPGLSDAGWVGVARGILWMADADTLSAYRITPEGLVAEGGPWPRLWTGSNSEFMADETRLYFDREVFDLDRRVFVGSDLGSVVASDPGSGSVYELSGWWLRRFTASGLEFRGEMRGPSTWLGARQLVRWGERGLAFLRPDGLLWIDEMALVSEAARSDVAVSLIPNVSEEYVGERVWRVHVTNLGASPVARVAVSLEGVSRMDPRGMEITGGHALGGVVFWDLEGVPAGGTVILPVWLQFPEGPFRIQARVGTGAAGDSPTNNWAEVSGMARHPVADLKSGWASPVTSEVWSAAFAGRLSVTNASSLEIANVEVRVRRSPGLSVSTASPGEIDAQCVTESVVVRLGSLAPGAITTVDVGFEVPGPGVYPVVAEVAGRNTEPTPADNRASMLLVAGWGTEVDGVRELSLPLVSAWAWDPRARELVGGVEGVSALVSVDPTRFRATRSMALPGVPRKVVLSADGEVAWVDLAGGGCLRIFRDRRLILDSWVWPWTAAAASFSWAVLPAGLDRDVLIAHGRGDDGVLSVLAYRGSRRLPTEYRLPNGLVGELTVSQDGRIWVSRDGSLVELVLRESGLELVREYPAAMGAAGRANWLGSRLIYESGIVVDFRTGTVDSGFGGGGSCYADPEVNWAYRVLRPSNGRGDAPVVVEGFASAAWRRVWQQPLATEFTRVETMVPMGTNGLLVQSTTAAWWVPVNAAQERTARLGVGAAGPMEVDSQRGLVTLPLGVTNAGPWVARAELFVDFGDELRPLGGLEGATGGVARLVLDDFAGGTNFVLQFQAQSWGEHPVSTQVRGDLPDPDLSDNRFDTVAKLTAATLPVLFVEDGEILEDRGRVRAQLSSPAPREYRVPFRIQPLSAQATDFLRLDGEFVFAPGTTEASVDILATDAVVERDETFRLVLTRAPVRTVRAEATLVIVDDDRAEVWMESVSRVEGSAGLVVVPMTARLSYAVETPVEVGYEIAPGTAHAGVDFVADVGWIRFEPGMQEARVGVRVMGDAEVEPDETIRVRWLESERVRWVSPEALLTLVNDDALAGLVIEPRWVVGAGLAIRWGTEAGRQYQVETKSELQDTEWVPFRAPLLGDGSVQEVLLPAAAMPRQFVRVRVN